MGNKFLSIKRNLTSLSDDMLPSGVRIESFSNKEAIVEGCKGILEYSDTYMKLNIGGGNVGFLGVGLYAHSYSNETLVIKGEIKNIEYCVGKKWYFWLFLDIYSDMSDLK